MSKATLLAASTTDPSMRRQSEFGDVVRPTLEFAHRSQRLAGSVVSVAVLHAAYLLNGALLVSLFLARYALYAAQIVVGKAAILIGWIWRNARQSRGAKRTWRKFEMEMTSLLFGPVGNGIALILLWPGWIVGFCIWTLWHLVG